MSDRELRAWAKFDALNQPLPDKLFDTHLAVISSLIVNLVRSGDSAPVSAADFFIIREPAPPPGDGPSEIDRLQAAWGDN